MIEPAAPPAPDSVRVAEARARATERLHRQRETLRPLGLAGIAVIVIGSASSHPAPAFHDGGLAVSVALVVFAGALLLAIRDGFPERPIALQVAVIVVMGAAGVAIAGLQLKGSTEVAAGVAVFMAVTRLPLRLGATLAAAGTVALAIVTGAAGGSSSAVVAAMLLAVLLGVLGLFLRRSRESEAETELLLAQLEDARDAQAAAAALAERSRIAGELHDVLAHSLSGAAIQLQGARKLADRAGSDGALRGAIDRAAELVKAGLGDARQAVGALRGDALPTVEDLPALVERYRGDLQLDIRLSIEGEPRALHADPSLALYRGAQEALTNVARYAPAAPTEVVLRYEPGRTRLSVRNGSSDAPPLHGLGGGHGLAGMRDRIERAGGTMAAGPSGEGWEVEIEVPQ